MVVKYSKNTTGNIRLTPHFRLYEFICPGSDTILIDSQLLVWLEQIHKHFNCKSITITSGYRTPEYSVKVGGFRNDQHTKGEAVDFICTGQDGKQISAKEVCCYAESLGINRIGFITGKRTYATHIAVGTKHWFGDEATGKSFNSFYSYFGIAKPVVYTIGKGSKVTLKLTAIRYATGQIIPARYKNKVYTVLQIKPDRLLLKEIMSWVYTKDVK